jgi:hypothetical protein
MLLNNMASDKIRSLVWNYGEATEGLLNDYSKWLEKKGYLDSDWYSEEPKTVLTYLEEVKK